MRIPIRSEGEAVRFVFASFAVIAVSVLVGWLVEPLVGVAIFAVAVVVAAIAYLRADNPDRHTVLADAATSPIPTALGAARDTYWRSPTRRSGAMNCASGSTGWTTSASRSMFSPQCSHLAFTT